MLPSYIRRDRLCHQKAHGPTRTRKKRLPPVDETFHFESPEIKDEDIAWVCSLLKLPKTAFSGLDGKDARLEVLRCTATLDIEACPGSGKTTLLVAKLAILASKWIEARRGICVLSHTNAARREIEKRLANTGAGQRLLAYPHFVGTIHSFTNEFLAMPWLHSLGYSARVIDNTQCELHRRRLLKLVQFSALASYVNRKEASGPDGKLNIVARWRTVSPTFEVLKESGEQESRKDGRGSPSRNSFPLCALARKCARDGYHRFDEMFMWGQIIWKHIPGMRDAIRQRFPMLFIDEVQDNSEAQDGLVIQIVHGRGWSSHQAEIRRLKSGDLRSRRRRWRNDRLVCRRQVYGRIALNSHPALARKSRIWPSRLALRPRFSLAAGRKTALIRSDTSGKHAVFLFADQTIHRVIASYAEYLLEVFSKRELEEGCFTVVGLRGFTDRGKMTNCRVSSASTGLGTPPN